MYEIVVFVRFENGEKLEKRFPLWGDAAAWIEYLTEGDSMPYQVKMTMIR